MLEPEKSNLHKFLSNNEIDVLLAFIKSDRFSKSDVSAIIRGNDSVIIKFKNIDVIYSNFIHKNKNTGQILRINPFFSDVNENETHNQ